MTVSAPPAPAVPRLLPQPGDIAYLLVLTATIAGAYTFGGLLGLAVTGFDAGPSVFWPPAGVALAAAVRFGWQALPGVVVGAAALTPVEFPLVAVGVIPGCLLSAALGGWLIRRGGYRRLPLDQLTDVGVLAVAAVFASTASAILGSVTLWAVGITPAAEVVQAIVVWWLGDVTGVLLIAPILLAPVGRSAAEWSRAATRLAWVGLGLCVGVAVGVAVTTNAPRLLAITACLPLMVIAAVRFGPRGAAIANLITAGVVAGVVVIPSAKIAQAVPIAFLAVSAITALSLGAVTGERDNFLTRLTADIAARIAAENERASAERATERSEARYRGLFESAPVAIWEEDLSAIADWFAELRAAGVADLAVHLAAAPHLTRAALQMVRVRDVNAAAVTMNRAADKAELLANLPRLFTPDSVQSFAAELVALWNGERTLRLETRAARLSGEPADIVVHMRVPESDGQPDFSRVVVIALDVTDQKRLEDQLRQSQKLEAVARLAGGIAHDFNNLLTVINGFAELIVAEASPDSAIAPLAANIHDAGRRAADLTRQLLAFSRKQTPVAGPVDLVALVQGLRPLLLPLVGDEVRLATRLTSVPSVLADRGQLESVVMNLAVNARDAMPGGGTLTIETGVADPERPRLDEPVGRWVVLSVSDTGTGIPEEVRPHLFEPFFTTKALGKGTGLGLPSVYGIVTTAGGHIRYETVIGRGTTFRVYLPLGSASGQRPVDSGQQGRREHLKPPTAIAADRELMPVSANHTNSHCPPTTVNCPQVLLVEDQSAVRQLFARMLTDAGFAVTTAANGPDALARLAAFPTGPDVLVTDVRMPQMGGQELARRVRSTHPTARVLFVSGYTPDEMGSHPQPGTAFLAKPFGAEELIDAVRALLGG